MIPLAWAMTALFLTSGMRQLFSWEWLRAAEEMLQNGLQGQKSHILLYVFVHFSGEDKRYVMIVSRF
jgi:hypothetical protein